LARYADFMPSEIEIENNYKFTKMLLELLWDLQIHNIF
jgi:hypothetical protein